MTQRKSQLIVALDVDTLEEAKRLVKSLSDVVDLFKVGSQLFVAYGPEIIRYLQSQGKKVFLDLKFHDIPTVVAKAVKAAVGEGLFMYTLHTLGGKTMLKEAVLAGRARARELDLPRPWAVGVTVLTSEEKNDTITSLVLERSLLAKQSGLDGVVASAQEAALIHQKCGEDFIVVTPGIRLEDRAADDQQRTATPAEAILNGSHYLVVGRPIIQASSPLEATQKILKDMKITIRKEPPA